MPANESQYHTIMPRTSNCSVADKGPGAGKGGPGKGSKGSGGLPFTADFLRLNLYVLCAFCSV